ncbi:MAG: ParA family protein [Nitrosomonas sp.]|nr:ParA family protein [Nitrosomonas sp.]
MKTLVTANQKGGVGKTAILVNLALAFFERGLRVVVLDLDVQANASFTLQEYASGFNSSQLYEKNGKALSSLFHNLPEEPLLKLIGSDVKMSDIEKRKISEVLTVFNDNINTLDTCGFDVALIDTAPSIGVNLITALCVADYVLSPIEMETYSIQGIKKMMTTIGHIRKTTNPDLVFMGMVPSKVDARNPRHVRHLKELTSAYPQYVIPATIGLRSSIADALASRIPVWRNKKTAARKAAKEVYALTTHVLKIMDIQS